MSSANQSTPTLEQLIRTAIESRLFDLHTSMPCVVESWDKAKNTVSVRPALKRKYKVAHEASELPIIQNVPIAYPRAAGWKITGPVQKGDQGQLVFSERSLDVWKERGGVVDPQDPRKFNLTDCWFFPGGWSPANPYDQVSDQNLRIENGSTRFELTPDGKMNFQKVGGDEILDLVIQLCEQVRLLNETLNTDTTNTIFGPMQLNAFSTYGTIKDEVATIKGKIEALKG